MSKHSTLITLTATTCGGKSHLFNYIRDVAKMPCLISTTTRAPRVGEKDGVDYYFITEEQSLELEAKDELAELAVYNGKRYGVTKKEFFDKLSRGVAFLIVEPTGIEHYAKPAIDVGAKHVKVWVDVPLDIRLERFALRSIKDISGATSQENAIRTVLKRHKSMLTEELGWKDLVKWDTVIDGQLEPEHNLRLILDSAKIL